MSCDVKKPVNRNNHHVVMATDVGPLIDALVTEEASLSNSQALMGFRGDHSSRGGGNDWYRLGFNGHGEREIVRIENQP